MLLLNGDCIEEMQRLIDDGVQVDSVVTDPPYHLTSIVERFGKEGSAPAQEGTDGAFARASKGFMGKEWDGGDIAFRQETWELAYKLLKPGGHLLAFSGSRTYHRMAVAVEDAGFEIRDQIMWIYGSGFPKSMNIGKNIDKIHRGVRHGTKDSSSEMHGVKREKIEGNTRNDIDTFYRTKKTKEYDFETEDGRDWDGWGTHLKPAHEPIVMARKPISEKSIAENVLKHGTGGINIDECRIEGEVKRPPTNPSFRDVAKEALARGGLDKLSFGQDRDRPIERKEIKENNFGRFPANVMHDGSDVVQDIFPETTSARIGNTNNPKRGGNSEPLWGMSDGRETHDYRDSGSASRYFYCPKVSKEERNKGLDSGDTKPTTERKNVHPTVKPIELMKYLCRLVTPKGGTVLDPFMGSGSTGMAAKDEGFDFIGIEKEEEYFEIAQSRIKVTAPLMEFFS